MSNRVYYVLKDADDEHYALLQGKEATVKALLEFGYLEGSADSPKLTEKGRAMRDSIGETGILEQRISEIELRTAHFRDRNFRDRIFEVEK